MSQRCIVVGTDFSTGARAALEIALRMAADSNAQVVLVHAYEDLDATAPCEPSDQLEKRLADEVDASGAVRRGVQVEPIVRRGAPWQKILNVATDYGAELVVVGATGEREATFGFPFGSVVSRVLALSTRSVLVVRTGH